MHSSVQKWGNSMGLRIPKSLADELRVGQGDRVSMKVRKGSLIVTPLSRKQYVLDELLQDVTPKNLHLETDTGAVSGREIW